MHTEELQNLLEKQQHGILNIEEAERLEAWDALLKQNNGITESLNEKEREALKQRMWSRIASEIS